MRKQQATKIYNYYIENTLVFLRIYSAFERAIKCAILRENYNLITQLFEIEREKRRRASVLFFKKTIHVKKREEY